MHRLIIALFVAAALAGCSDAPKPSTCDAPDSSEPCIETLDGLGSIRGVVVDDAIVPVEGAIVTVGSVQPPLEATTDENGLFLFNNIEPGVYELDVGKAGFQSLRVRAAVEEGDNPLLKIQFSRIPGFNAFYSQFQWDGYIQCNTTNANICLIINYYPDFLLGTGAVTNDASSHLFYEEFVDVGRHPDWTQIETAWESTQPTGERLSIRYQSDRPDTLLIDCPYGAGGTRESASPQIFSINRTKAEDLGLGMALAEDPDPDDNCDPTEANGLGMEFFSGDALGVCQSTPVGCHPRAGSTLEQRTQTFVTAFYDYLPPEGWNFIAASDVPAPPQ